MLSCHSSEVVLSQTWVRSMCAGANKLETHRSRAAPGSLLVMKMELLCWILETDVLGFHSRCMAYFVEMHCIHCRLVAF